MPGTRWFRADLHLHTLDDPYVELPASITGARDAPMVLRAYAEAFLDAAVEQGIQVLGLTPHAASVAPGISAAWTIVNMWRDGVQPSSGRPYRDLIYAVFPGFEPNFADGNKGIHLIFLFDSTIGKDRYLSAFGAIMGARAAYEGTNLNWAQKDPAGAFKELDDVKAVGRGNYLVIAPHPLQENGLLSRPGHYITDLAGGRVQAAEVGRNCTLDEDLECNGKLRHAFEHGRVALYHASDAIRLPLPGAVPRDRELGFRYALVKLATPSLEALRQAFLGRDSRLRPAFAREGSATLVPAGGLPDPLPQGPDARPWIREIRIRGGTSFLRDQPFRFSPDLTCIIGGSMTGKSTLLDGLRFFLGGEDAMPPAGTQLGRDARARARDLFLSGGPDVLVESPAGDLSRPVGERFPVRFFSQGELKSLAEDDDGLEHLLFHLVPGRARELLAQREELRILDRSLKDSARELSELQQQVADAEQHFLRAQEARTAMERFAEAGTALLTQTQQDAARSRTFLEDVTTRTEGAGSLADELAALEIPEIEDPGVARALTPDHAPDGAALLSAAQGYAKGIVQALETLQILARALERDAVDRRERVTTEVQAALVKGGGTAADLNQFDAFARAARHHDSFKAALEGKIAARERALNGFWSDRAGRDRLVESHREAVGSVCTEVQKRFAGRVEVEIVPQGRQDPLRDWLLSLRNNGITRWWNGGGESRATPTRLCAVAQAVSEGRVADAVTAAQDLGMSEAVARTFLEQLAPWERQLEVFALRSPDRYRIRWHEDDGQPKDLFELSGGRRVAVLLSLLLESDDTTPLFVDQPEDELDNRFLNETIIPALHRLKGRRQVVFVTHNANLVVNGDADQVIALEANSTSGRVYAAGAIEEESVREAIVRTLDGGPEAFRLRRAKYGF